jgi:hypothetical protein
LKDRFPVANTYANWAAHIGLSEGGTVASLLCDVNDALIRYRNGEGGPGPSDLAKSMSEGLGVARLRAELRELFASHCIDAPFLDSLQQWHSVLASMFGVLLNKPISFPLEDPSKWKASIRHRHDLARDRFIQAFGNARGFVNQASFVLVPFERDAARGSIHWLCGTEGGFAYQSSFTGENLEPRSAFTSD